MFPRNNYCKGKKSSLRKMYNILDIGVIIAITCGYRVSAPFTNLSLSDISESYFLLKCGNFLLKVPEPVRIRGKNVY